MRISDWSSDVCSSDLRAGARGIDLHLVEGALLEAGEGSDAERADRIAGRSRRVVADDEAAPRAGAADPGPAHDGCDRAADRTVDGEPAFLDHGRAREAVVDRKRTRLNSSH